MAKLDAFTSRRLTKTVEEIRRKTGELPTLKALADQGFPEATVKAAVHEGLLESLYVTLTNGVIVKGYKVKT
jgi:hypothetical protein